MSDLSSLRVPTWCPICKLVMRTMKSNATYYNWGCCEFCYIEFIEGREERWSEGWRPSDEAVEAMLRRGLVS